ncbi:hypothetical protein BGZ58_010906 [Dissophora ornata]|nr:hypothetical protein BGZ58_010906 [Dissophora ornata]
MSQKGTDPNASETNEGDLPQAPPPSYDSNVNKSQYAPPSGPPPGQSTFHQAQSADGSSSGPYQYPEQQQQQQTFAAPPSGVYSSPPGGYAPPTGAYAPPAAGTYILPQPAPGHTQTVVYVVDEPMMMEHPGIPVAMICFIFGLQEVYLEDGEYDGGEHEG